MRRQGFLAFATLAAGALAGCVLITGSTSGYTLEDAGGSAAVVEAGVCVAESGVCFDLGCVSSANCDAGMVCCASVGSPTGLTCQSSCPADTLQACGANAECGDAGPCIDQECALLGPTYEIRFCGLVPGCTEVASGGSTSTDAGAHD